MCLIQNTDHFLSLYATDDFHFLLELSLGIPTVKPGFYAKLVEHSLVEPPGCQLGV